MGSGTIIASAARNVKVVSTMDRSSPKSRLAVRLCFALDVVPRSSSGEGGASNMKAQEHDKKRDNAIPYQCTCVMEFKVVVVHASHDLM